jgi:hypothetical protein
VACSRHPRGLAKTPSAVLQTLQDDADQDAPDVRCAAFKEGTDALPGAKLSAKLALFLLGVAGQVMLNLVVLQAIVIGPRIGIANGPAWPRIVGIVATHSECRGGNAYCGNQRRNAYCDSQGNRTNF